MFPLIAAGAMIGSALLDNNSQKKALSQAEKQRAQSLEFINKQLANSRSDLLNMFGQAQGSQQQWLNFMAQAFPQQLSAFQDGNVMAQNTLLAGLPQANSALLGNAVDMSALQAHRVPVNAQMLSGMLGPESMQLAPLRGM